MLQSVESLLDLEVGQWASTSLRLGVLVESCLYHIACIVVISGRIALLSALAKGVGQGRLGLVGALVGVEVAVEGGLRVCKTLASRHLWSLRFRQACNVAATLTDLLWH